jgi:hypothetical protein
MRGDREESLKSSTDRGLRLIKETCLSDMVTSMNRSAREKRSPSKAELLKEGNLD